MVVTGGVSLAICEPGLKALKVELEFTPGVLIKAPDFVHGL